MSRYEVGFPQEVPVRAFADLFGFFTAGTLSENAGQAIEAGYNVVGYGAKIASEAVSGPPVIGDAPMNEEEAFRQVGRQSSEMSLAPDGVQVVGAINPALLLAAAKFVAKYILPLLLK